MVEAVSEACSLQGLRSEEGFVPDALPQDTSHSALRSSSRTEIASGRPAQESC